MKNYIFFQRDRSQLFLVRYITEISKKIRKALGKNSPDVEFNHMGIIWLDEKLLYHGTFPKVKIDGLNYIINKNSYVECFATKKSNITNQNSAIKEMLSRLGIKYFILRLFLYPIIALFYIKILRKNPPTWFVKKSTLCSKEIVLYLRNLGTPYTELVENINEDYTSVLDLYSLFMANPDLFKLEKIKKYDSNEWENIK